MIEKNNYQKQEDKIQNELDKYIFSIFDLSEADIDLIDYALNISIPLYKGKKSAEDISRECDNSTLESYADVFIEHFNMYFDKNKNEFFHVEVHKTPQFIAMVFIVDKEIHDDVVIKENSNFNKIINKLGILSLDDKESFYIRRDFKGIENNKFYIIKPNEFKNWHKAVARNDITKFMGELSNLEEL